MKNKSKNLPGIALAVVGGLLAAVGLVLGQNAEVLIKAVNVCLECIGIG